MFVSHKIDFNRKGLLDLTASTLKSKAEVSIVARWDISIPKITVPVCFGGHGMENVGMYIVLPFGIFHVFWYI
jgi:hypothetical protein